MSKHRHELLYCPDCLSGPGELNGCSYCDGRGYYEFCRICNEPMGNERRRWKRAGSPVGEAYWAWLRNGDRSGL